ncbi:MAG TPA: hypothetical protein VEY51_19555, partial [Chondromyces sp.]|nr:hypothetical protein [Chondromyces sp.]
NGEGIRILIDALQLFDTIIDQYEVTDVVCVATAAIRQAANKNDILLTVQEKTGFTINLLNEYEEAYYGFLGVVHSTDIDEGITIDMGGGSTEITHFRHKKMLNYHSFPFGSLSVKLKFVTGTLPTRQEREQVRTFIRSQLETLPWVIDKKLPVVAIGGSARNVAQIHQHLVGYPLAGTHQYEMNVSEIEFIKKSLYPLSYEELQKTEGLSKDRVDTILPALEVFDVLGDITRATRFKFSTQGLRNGIIYQKINNASDQTISMADESIHQLLKEFHLHAQDKTQEMKLATSLFKQVKEFSKTNIHFDKADLDLLIRGIQTFHLGEKVNEESSRTTFCLLSNRNFLGVSHKDRIKLALIASYKGKGTFRKYIHSFKEWFSKEEQKKLCILGAIIKLSHNLNTTKRNVVLDIKITPNGADWMVNIKCRELYQSEAYHFNREKKHLEKLLKTNIIPIFHALKSDK